MVERNAGERFRDVELQHEMLFRIIEELDGELSRAGDPALVSDLIEQLCAYVVLHFATEETLMAEVEYPWLDGHRIQHEATRAKLFQLQAEHQRGDETSAGDCLALMRAWSREHIPSSDAKLAAYLGVADKH